jgi:hypothetical protein
VLSQTHKRDIESLSLSHPLKLKHKHNSLKDKEEEEEKLGVSAEREVGAEIISSIMADQHDDLEQLLDSNLSFSKTHVFIFSIKNLTILFIYISISLQVLLMISRLSTLLLLLKGLSQQFFYFFLSLVIDIGDF